MLRYPIRSFIYGFNNKLIRIEEKLVSLRRARNEPLQSSSSVRMELFSYDTPAESIVIDKTNIRLFFYGFSNKLIRREEKYHCKIQHEKKSNHYKAYLALE